MLVELKNGETLNGHLVNCDTWMNLTLKEVVQTSPEGDKFFRLPEVYVRGNNVGSLKLLSTTGRHRANVHSRSNTLGFPRKSSIWPRSSNIKINKEVNEDVVKAIVGIKVAEETVVGVKGEAEEDVVEEEVKAKVGCVMVLDASRRSSIIQLRKALSGIYLDKDAVKLFLYRNVQRMKSSSDEASICHPYA
jgi:small nuclear ribonucleoprotein (snRNP)-like protein